jgi:peroxiredoxin
MAETLKALLGALHEERVRTWPPARLQVNVDQRRELVDQFDPTQTVAVGDIVPEFTLADVDGGQITRDELAQDGLVALVFFRFAGCPACNIALPHYERALWPELQKLGVRLVAVSPQIPERLVEIRDRQGLTFTVASDRDNHLARQLGITYSANAASRAGGEGPGWIGETVGTYSWELPQPTVILFGRGGRVIFADVSPDWLVRTEAGPVLNAVLEQAEPA